MLPPEALTQKAGNQKEVLGVGIRRQWCWAEGQASAYQTGRGHLRHCGSGRLSAALRAAGCLQSQPTPTPQGAGCGRTGQPSSSLSVSVVGGAGEGEVNIGTNVCVRVCLCVHACVCLCVCRAPCGREGRGKGEWSCYGGQPHTSTSGRGHKYPVSGVTGTKLEPPSTSGVQGPPSLQKVFPWGLEEGAWECAHRQRFRIVSERKRRGSGVPGLLPARCVTVGELLYSPEPQFPCLKFSDKSLCLKKKKSLCFTERV